MIYSPLIYLVAIAFPTNDETLRERLSDLVSDPLAKLLRIYAILILLLFSVKMVIHIGWNSLADSWNSMWLSRYIDVYMIPEKVPRWQVASAMNSIITIALFFFGSKAIVKLDRGRWRELVVERIVGWAIFVRELLSIYTVVCLLYITVVESNLFDYLARIRFGTSWFPWE